LLIHGDWIRSDVSKSYQFPTVFKVQLAWSEKHAQPGERILVGDTFEGNLFYFKGKTRAEYLTWPKLDSMDQAAEFVRNRQVRYAFVDLATAFYNPQVFKEYYQIQMPGLIARKKDLPPPFKPLPRDPRIPAVFDLYDLR
jgi:hypothetical protein